MTTVILLLLSLPLCGGAQPIVFHLPDKVEKKANKWIQTLTDEASQQVYFRLGIALNPAYDYELCCCTGLNSDTAWGRYARNSNSFLSINNQLYPLSFDFDEYYGLDTAQVLDPPGRVGFREGLIKRQLTIFHGSRIVFKQNDTLHDSHKCGLWLPFSKRRKIVKEVKTSIDNRFQSDSLPIVYFINDQVETTIANYLKERGVRNAYVVLSQNNGVKLLELYYRERDNNDYNDAIVTRTNRFLLAGEDRIPIILDYAILFRERPTDYNTINMQIGNDTNEPSLVLECL